MGSVKALFVMAPFLVRSARPPLPVDGGRVKPKSTLVEVAKKAERHRKGCAAAAAAAGALSPLFHYASATESSPLRCAMRQLDAIVVSIGGGGLIAGIATYIKAMKPSIKVAAKEAAQHLREAT